MDILLKSLLAAGVTAAILLLASVAGPRLAGALGGIPIVFAISYLILTSTSQQPSLIQGFLSGGIWGAVAGLVFPIFLLLLQKYSPNTYWINFLVAYGVCLAIAYFASGGVKA